jgi:hypothetical protein
MNYEAAVEVGSISFYEIFIALNNYYQQTGSFTVPLNHPTMAFILDGLTAMGAESLIEDRWNEKMEDLISFKSQHGHCNTNTKTDDLDLDQWTQRQREYYRLYDEEQPTPLTTTRYERLKDVGLLNAPNKWEERLEDLRHYKLEHGDADVPIDYPKLGIWCLNQRFNLENMPQERIDKLDELGFTWNYNTRSSNEEAWNAKYDMLLDFIRENGHPNVPKSNEPLSCWVRKQRYEYSKFIKKKKSQITRERISKLNEVGFSFRLRADTIPWDQRYEDLVLFKQEHGHFNIPRNHPTLGSWSVYTKTQFKYFLEGRASTLDQTKADKLIRIGFCEIESHSQPVLPQIPPPEHGAMNTYDWENDFAFGFGQG